ncbi:MAG: type 1 glutamine amidotransferase [Candidatus Aegiribacteria sp.]|nr:type 1 glutamine amidotransferase [Candidatus Aegiribacteria sp.]
MIHPPNVLILDYSVDRSEGPLFRRWLPDECESTTVFVYSREDIPDTGVFTHVMHTGSSLSICSDAEFYSKAERVILSCVENGIPQMGVCYGHQLLCRVLVGPSSVRKCNNGLEAGWRNAVITGTGLNIQGVRAISRVFQFHFDEVVVLPSGAEIIATSRHTGIQGFMDKARRILSLQFHPEFSRKDGNHLFFKERRLLEENGFDLATIQADGPNIDAGRVFFSYFMSSFQKSGEDQPYASTFRD